MDNAILDEVVRVLRASRSILFVTGAGISADSGIPTYRGIGGLYDVEVTAEGLPIEVILSGDMLREDPQLTWKYLLQIGDAARGAKFNRAHQVIAELENSCSRVWTLTQNVDGFHTQAGARQVIEIHGNMRFGICLGCGDRSPLDSTDTSQVPPVCDRCKAAIRPDVVLFGECLPSRAVETMQRELTRGFGAVVAVGTSALFPYIQEPIYAARRRGAPTIEINPAETLLSCEVDYRLELGAAAALAAIWDRWTDRAPR